MKTIFIIYSILIHFKNSNTATKIKNIAIGLCLESNQIKHVFTNYCSSLKEQNWINIEKQLINGILNYQIVHSLTSLCLESDYISKKIIITECSQRDSQKWNYTWNRDLQNADTGSCLESDSMHKVNIRKCNGNTQQKCSVYKENILEITTIDATTSETSISITISPRPLSSLSYFYNH